MCKTKRIILRIIKFANYKDGITASSITQQLCKEQTYHPTTREVQNHLDDLKSEGLVEPKKSYYTGWVFYKLAQGNMVC